MSRTHEMTRRVYYHHTDAGGIVYHARFFDFAEEGRGEYFHEHLLDLAKIVKEYDCHFVTVNAVINWKASARLNDILTIKTTLKEIRRSSTIFEHIIENDGKVLADILITLVCINSQHKVMAVPEELKIALL